MNPLLVCFLPRPSPSLLPWLSILIKFSTASNKKSFKQSKDELAIVAKAIAPAISKLVNVSKSMEDAGELGSAARAMSDTMPMLVTAVRNSVAATAAGLPHSLLPTHHAPHA